MKMRSVGVISVSLLIFTVFSFSCIAVQNNSEGKNMGTTEVQNIEAVQQQNQAEEKEIQNQTTEQVGENKNLDTGNNEDKGKTEAGAEQTIGEGNENGSENGQKVQNQTNQNQSNQGEQTQNRVSNAVQTMLAVADRSGEVGQKIRIVAQSQNQNQEELETELNKAKSRSGIVKMIIGPNYKELKKVENRLENHNKNLEELKELRDQITDSDDKNIMEQQIQVMEQVQAELENEVNNEKKGVSLFGWLFRWFAK